MFLKVTKNSIDREEALAQVRHPSCGAVATFEGNIRNTNQGKRVLGLEYQVYEEFLRAEVERICHELKEKWEVHELALIQRIGRLDVGEAGIFIAVSSPHRRESLEACAYVIEEFKKRAPVWKKEYYEDSEAWVGCDHSSKPWSIDSNSA